MALDEGNAACTSGLSKRIYDYRVDAGDDIGLEDDHTALKADCYAIAQAVVDEIAANAVVNPTLLIAPSGGGPVTGTGTVS